MANKATGGKSRKAGRSKISCQAYRSSGRREVNKFKRLLRSLRSHPNDPSTLKALNDLWNYRDRAVKEMRHTGYKGNIPTADEVRAAVGA